MATIKVSKAKTVGVNVYSASAIEVSYNEYYDAVFIDGSLDSQREYLMKKRYAQFSEPCSLENSVNETGDTYAKLTLSTGDYIDTDDYNALTGALFTVNDLIAIVDSITAHFK